jgi:uncharacterized membrane protein YidH (DUF202 family)
MNIGVRPTGPDGTYTRRDHLREAGYAFGVVLVLVALLLADAAFSHWFNHDRIDGLYAGVLVAASLGMLVAGVACLAYLLQAAFTRKGRR